MAYISRLFSSSNQIDPDAKAWAAAVVAAGATVSKAQLARVSKMLRTFKVAGIRRDFALLGKAENETQASIDLFGRRTVTKPVTPVFTAWRGWAYNGSSQYIDSGFDASLNAVYMTGSDMQIDVWESANVAAGTLAAGVIVATNKRLELVPRTGGGQFLANLNSDNVTGITNSTSVGLNVAYRTGTTFGFYKNGVDQGTAVPASNATVLPGGTIFIGARRNGASPQSYRASTHWWDAWGPSLTAAQQLVYYTALNTYMNAVIPDTYVSSVSYGGIPIGVDATATGSSAAPYLTWDAAYAATPSGGKIILNGNPASPPTYQSSSTTAIAKALSVSAVNDLGAKLAGAGSARAVQINPAAGETVNISNLIIDAAQNTGGTPAALCVELLSQAIPYRVNCTGVKFTGWTGTNSYSVRTLNAACKAYLTFNQCIQDGGTSTYGGFHLDTLSAGSVTITGGTHTLTDNKLQSRSVIHIAATSTGVTASITGATVNFTTTDTSAAVNYGIYVENCANALVDSCTVTGTCPASSRQFHGICVQSGYSTPLDASGSTVSNCTVYNYGYGGVGIGTTEANGGVTKQIGMVQSNNTVIGNSNSATTGLHGHFWRETANSYITNPQGNTIGLGIVDKLNSGLIVTTPTLSNCYSSYYLAKGSTNSTITGMSLTAGATWTGNMIVVADDPTAPTHSTGIAFTGHTLTVNGAAAINLVQVDTSNTATFSTGTYTLTSGSVSANPWAYQSTNYATFAAWQAAKEPTASSNIP